MAWKQKEKGLEKYYQRCRSSDHPALIVVLGSMARADEFVLSCIPWHDASKVSANCIDSICRKRFILLDYKVGRVSLKSIITGLPLNAHTICSSSNDMEANQSMHVSIMETCYMISDVHFQI